jgi:hypothetical protein
MTECNEKLKLYDVEIKDENFYFKNPVGLAKNTKLGNNITQKDVLLKILLKNPS